MKEYFTLPPICEEMQQQGDVMKTDSVHIREDATGHMICWGCGEFGQHGHGYKKEVQFLDGAVEMFCSLQENRVKHVACGASHTAVVTNNNDLYLWGNGSNGQLGTTDLQTVLQPRQLSILNNNEDKPSIAGVTCGGRHTVVWLDNGHVYSFGNNLHAQLGYDFRQKGNKEIQKDFWEDEEENDQSVPQPTLLRSLINKPVAQVACGDKHTLFRFQDGAIASVGNNCHGQIGSGDRLDALDPKFIDGFNQPVTHIAAGSQHSLAVTESGELYVWGYSKACGSNTEDILVPTKLATHKHNVISVAGGSTHSMALTANGSVYTWGAGSDGQLGHGQKIRFLSSPRRVKDRHVICKCIQISCGEAFSAAITEKGLLYMWGKNSHTIMPDKPTSHKIFLPHGVNKNFRGGRFNKIFCGSWHAVALIGRPQLLLRQETESEESTDDLLTNHLDDIGDDSESDVEITSPVLNRQPSRITNMEREKTTVSIADFYAPTPDINQTYRSPSPEFYYPNDDDDNDKYNLNSTRSAATLIVQLPVQPMTTFADAATSPMTLTTTSSSKSSSITTLSRVPSPVAEYSYRKLEKLQRKKQRPEKKFKEFDPQKYERERLRSSTTPVSEVVQMSRTSADAFILPRETTGLSKKHVDFSEMEEIRLKGPRSPEKLSRLSKHKENRESSPSKFRVPSPEKYRDLGPSRGRHRYVDSSLSIKSDSALMESPLFRGSRKNVVTEMGHRAPLESLLTEDGRQYKHHVPKHHPRKYNKSQLPESNFGLQISRTQTIIAPVQIDSNDPSDRLSQLRRYAATHNPQTSVKPGGEKLRPIKNRHVSIPGVRAESPDDDRDQLCIGGVLNGKDKPMFSSGSTWKDRSDLEILAPRKIAAAGIVKMYIANQDMIGSMKNPLYASLSDGRGHSDSMIDTDTLIVQPLLKRTKRGSDDCVSLEVPNIAINQNTANQTTSNLYSTKGGEIESSLTDTQGTDKMIHTRAS